MGLEHAWVMSGELFDEPCKHPEDEREGVIDSYYGEVDMCGVCRELLVEDNEVEYSEEDYRYQRLKEEGF